MRSRMMKTHPPRIGLLPLYLKLYDDKLPELRKVLSPFLNSVADAFTARGVEVVRTRFCRVKPEFDRAMACFEQEDVDCVVTLHLAYSPSLESIEAFTRTKRPILILDTTLDFSFGREVASERILYNHGIHGVMDMASMLRRRGKPFQIVAGHVRHSRVMDRAIGIILAARAARHFREMRVLRIGESFEGMGDFGVQEDVLRRVLGIRVDQMRVEALAADVRRVTPREVEAEMSRDRKLFNCRLPKEVHARSVRVGLGLRRRLKDGKYGAFSMNFLVFNQSKGLLCTLPFLEASKSMARGIGYAGEGDVLTAALVGALQRGFGRTSFTEIFCPDWKGDAFFLSHMGEINPAVAAKRPAVIEKPFPFTNALNPAVLVCAPAPGPALFVNLAPGPRNTFDLLVAPVEVLGDARRAEMRQNVRGWIRPRCGVKAFLETYSRQGGTHHSALVLGAQMESLEAFAAFAGIPCHVLHPG